MCYDKRKLIQKLLDRRQIDGTIPYIFWEWPQKDVELLRFLYLQKRFVPIEEISQTLGLDRRSVQKSFDSLTKQLANNQAEKTRF